MVPNAALRSEAIPIVVILNAAADLTSEVVPNVEVRIVAPNAATLNVVIQFASGDFPTEAVLIVVQDVAPGAVLRSAVPRFVVTQCVQVAVILCVATPDATVVLQTDSPMVPAFGVLGVVPAGRCRFAPDA